MRLGSADLSLLLSAVGGSYGPEVMQSSQEFIQILSDGGSEASQAAWKMFLYNTEQVPLLGNGIGTTAALAIIGGGFKWNRASWTTSGASKKNYELTQVPLVTADFVMYRNTWLYCLPLVWNVEVQELTLSDPAADAAFRLASVCSSGVGDWLMEEEDEEGEEEHKEVTLECDEPGTKFPEELAYIWKVVLYGERHLDLKCVLKKFPRFEGP